MFDGQIMPVGKKLKKYRELLELTQSEIAQGACSKSMISQIENGKEKLSDNLAEAFVERINTRIRDKKLDIKFITVYEIMIDEDEQANSIFTNSIMKELQEIKDIDLFDKKLSEAEELIEKYNIADNKKIELYELSADFYYKQHKYIESNKMCKKALDVNTNLKSIVEEINIYIYKSRNSIVTGDIEALDQLNYAEELNNTVDNDKFFEDIYINRALAYKKLKKYDRVLWYLNILKKKLETKNKKMPLKAKMIYANCLMDQDISFEEAKKEYIEILDRAKEIDNKGFIAQVYRNLSELHFNNKKHKDAIDYIKISLKNHPVNECINETYYFASKICNEEAEEYLLKALNICEKNDRENTNLIKDVIHDLVLIYMKKDNEEEIQKMLEKAKELNINCNKIYAQLTRYYIDKDINKSKHFNKLLIDNIE
ncbi:helix-turn-helix domain-containing protein [Clostridium saccharoperbutylacetonicum]